MEELDEGKRKWRRRSREEIAVLVAGLRESGQMLRISPDYI